MSEPERGDSRLGAIAGLIIALALLAVVWIAMWLFGLNLLTLGLLLLGGGVLVLQPGSRTASRHHG